jgi:hypothetical protein
VFLGTGANARFGAAWKDVLYLEIPHEFLPTSDTDRVDLAQLSCVVGDKNSGRSQPTQRTGRCVPSDDTAYGISPTGDTHSLSSVMVHRVGEIQSPGTGFIVQTCFSPFSLGLSLASTSIEYTEEVPCRTLRHRF